MHCYPTQERKVNWYEKGERDTRVEMDNMYLEEN